MSWGRWCDRAPFHRKFLTLSNDAVALAWRANQWSRSAEASASPGFLTRKELWALRGDGVSTRRFNESVQELIDAGKPAHEVGILEPVDGGFVIHDFEDYGPPAGAPAPEAAEQNQAKLDQRRAAGKASADARRARSGSAQPPRRPNETGAEARTTSNETPNGLPNETSNDPERATEREIPLPHTPSPIPDPDPDPDLSANSGTFEVSRAGACAPNEPRTNLPNEDPNEPRSFVERCKLWQGPDRMRAHALAPFPETWNELVSLEQLCAEAFGRRVFALRRGDARVVKALERGAEGYDFDQLAKAIRGASRDDHLKRNPQFQTLNNIFKDSAQVDRFILLADAPIAGPPRSRLGPVQTSHGTGFEAIDQAQGNR